MDLQGKVNRSAEATLKSQENPSRGGPNLILESVSSTGEAGAMGGKCD